MKQYIACYVERAGFPGAEFDWFEAESDKAVKADRLQALCNQSINRGHCGVRIFRDGKCVARKFKGA